MRRAVSPTVLAGLYLVVVLAPLGLVAASARTPLTLWIEASVALGIVSGIGFAVQFITSGRLEILSGGVGIDVTMAFHKWSARLLLALALAHPLVLAGPAWFTDPASAWQRMALMMRAPNLQSGVAAMALLVALVALAVLRGRMRYEFWRAVHGILALGAIALIVHHALAAGLYSADGALRLVWLGLGAAVFATVVYLYLVRTIMLRRNPWQVARVEPLARGLWQVTLQPLRRALEYRAGQFVWMSLAGRRIPLFDHPFSIASSPRAGPALDLVIKEAGDFTDRTGALQPGTEVGLDGPHGSFVLPQDATRVLLIAGGAGIAPILGILRDLALSGFSGPVGLIYAGPSEQDMIPPRHIAAAAAGLAFRPVFVAERTDGQGVHRRGTIDGAVLRDALGDGDPADTTVMLCGPDALMTGVADTLHDLGVPLANIHYERFDYAHGARSRRDRAISRRFWAMGAAIVLAVIAVSLR